MSTPEKTAEASVADAPDVREGYRPDNWLAGEVGRTDPGSEAWSLLHWLMISTGS